MEAIVLAGGFGTRLKDVVYDVPKPMAPMDEQGTPFLACVLEDLFRQGIGRVVLSVGYMRDAVENYFGSRYRNMPLVYSYEEQPLGTGGAVKQALAYCENDDVFVLNGDTFFAVDLEKMQCFHREQCADVTLAVRAMQNFDRYGTLVFNGARICSFQEKQPMQSGWINGGIYCLRHDALQSITKKIFSLQKDFLESHVEQLRLCAFPSAGYFIDIGIPEDYYRARKDWTRLWTGVSGSGV